MTKEFDAQRLRLNAVQWLQAATSPIGVENSVVGSFAMKSPASATGLNATFLNTGGGINGWTKQNTINLNVFNVRDYGAVGNGVTDDTVAIRAAIDACNTAGGGIVYFQPGSYKVGTRLTSLASFELSNVHNILFLGDGYASKILMIGNGNNADWYLFYLVNGTSNIRHHNLYFDGAGVTNADEQTHLMFYAAQTSGGTAPNGGARDCTCEGNYFGPVNGDCVRFLGTRISGVDVPTFRHGISDNMVRSTACRSGVAVQRYAHKIQVVDNFFTGSDDQQIDMEPTGGASPDNTPLEFVIVGNQMDHGSKSVTCVTLNGNSVTAPSARSIFAYNIVRNGCVVEMRDGSRWIIHGNILLYTAATGGDIGLSLTDGVNEIEVSANILDRPNRTDQLYRAIFLNNGSSTRQRAQLLDNVGHSYGTVAGGNAINIDGANDVTVDGNVMTHDNATANVSAIYRANASIETSDGFTMIGNMAISLNANALALYQIGTTGAFAFGGWLINDNYGRGSGTGLRAIITGGGSFANWRGGMHNNFKTIANSTVAITGFASGITIEGNAGPSSRFIECAATPVGNVPSVKGSVALNTAGSSGGVFGYKEAASSPTDTFGWLFAGPGDTTFAAGSADTVTAARFLAPGMALATASSTEIQIAAPRPGKMRAIYVSCIAGVGASNVTYTYRKNGVDQALTVTIANTATSGNGSGSVAFVAGDRHSVKITKSAGVATAQTMVSASLEQNG